MSERTKKQIGRLARKRRVRGLISGNAERPRMSVFRSLTSISVQIIDDSLGKTLVAASDRGIKKGKPMEKAREVGKNVAELAKKVKISRVIFDRNGYKYHGRVKVLADAAREFGLEF